MDPDKTIYGVAVGPSGGCLVAAVHDGEAVTVESFALYPPSLAALGQELQQLPAESSIVIDAGLHGLDLWYFLGRKRSDGHWRLLELVPTERRAELVGRLRAAYEQGAFRIVRGLSEEDALRRALAAATREDAHERVEVCALSLAVIDRRKPALPLYVVYDPEADA
jgi:hypothetical protein